MVVKDVKVFANSFLEEFHTGGALQQRLQSKTMSLSLQYHNIITTITDNTIAKEFQLSQYYRNSQKDLNCHPWYKRTWAGLRTGSQVAMTSPGWQSYITIHIFVTVEYVEHYTCTVENVQKASLWVVYMNICTI